MRKIYLGAIGILGATTLFAQAPLAKKATVLSESKKSKIVRDHAKVTLWSSDFSDPTDWTLVDNTGSGDEWVIGTAVPSGPFAIDTINSTTRANGYALYDSDLGCSGDQDADVRTAAPIDLTGQPYVSVQFESYYRKYLGNAYVIASTDGTNWTEIEVHSTLTPNQSTANPELVVVNLSSVIGNSPTAYIGFRYRGGCDYAWMVDDVELMVTEQYDLSYEGTFFGTVGYWGARLPYYQIPLSQAQPIEFSGIAQNNGYATQTDIVYTAAITSAGFSTSSAPGTLTENQIDTLDAPGTFTPTANGTYVISSAFTSGATDATPADNMNAAAATFVVNDRYYARDMGVVTGGSYNQGEEFDVGNVFDIFEDATLYSVRVFVSASSVADHTLRVRVHNVSLPNPTPLVSTDYILTANDLGTWVTIPLDQPFDMMADSSYIVTAGGYGDNGATDDIVIGTSGVSEPQTTFYYDPTAANGPWFYTTSTPMVQLDFANPATLSENGADLGVALYPNPAVDATNVSFNMPAGGEATVTVVDVTGKTVQTIALGNLTTGKQVVDLNTAALAAGSYTVKITAAGSVNTKKLIVRK